MAWTVFDTENARYVLLVNPHSKRVEKAPEEFDVVLLESAGTPEKTAKFWQNERLVEQALKGGKQIWVTDVEPSGRSSARGTAGALVVGGSGGAGIALLAAEGIKRMAGIRTTRRRFIKNSLIAVGLMSPALARGSLNALTSQQREIKREGLWETSAKMGTLVYGKGEVTMRNLITAEKAENFLAPRLRDELGRRPVIAISMGADHYLIKRLLKNPDERRKLLREHELERYVVRDYPKSYRVHLDERGEVRRVEEHRDTIGRRGFFRRLAGRKTHRRV